MQIGIVKHRTKWTFHKHTACRLDKSGSAGRQNFEGN